MKLSTDRILTTHVGSLPRPGHLAELLMLKDRGAPYDKDELERDVRQAVAAIVQRQSEAGIDIIDDGEMSKPGYSTYIADRLSGFAGHAARKPPLDTKDYPSFNAAMTRMTARRRCAAPIASVRSRCKTARRSSRTSPISARRSRA
jgi:5-methyltetrahydropteroyltriglutamate--homocysteine methyltransferase